MKNIFLFVSVLILLLSISSNSHADTYDSSASVFLFQKQMAKRGNAESQFKLGLMYETGSGVDQSPVLATSWYKKAKRQNYKPAANRLTYLEIKKTGFTDKHADWLKDLKNDARFNEGEALFLLGQMYSEGTGVNKSLTRSLKLLRKAAGGNIPGADAEIARVEEELNQLQKQYISKEEKEKTKAAVIVPVKKVAKPRKPVKKASSPKINKNRKTAAKKPNKSGKAVKKRNTTKSSTTTGKQKTSKKPAAPTKTKTISAKPASAKPVPVTQEVKKEEEHPMDTICGGRNRFSRGCR